MQITLGALALLSSVALALRVLRRGEREVLEDELRRWPRRHGRLTPGDPLGARPRRRRATGATATGPRPARRVRAARASRRARRATRPRRVVAPRASRRSSTASSSAASRCVARSPCSASGFFADGDVGVGRRSSSASLVGSLVFAAIALLYAPLLMARTNGQTLGKMAAGMPRRARRTAGAVDFWWAALREVVVKGLARRHRGGAHRRPRVPRRRPLAAVRRAEPGAARLRRGLARRPRLGRERGAVAASRRPARGPGRRRRARPARRCTRR